MRNVIFILLVAGSVAMIACFNSCQQDCVNNVLLETTVMDVRVNSNNLGVPSNETKNSVDTIRNPFKQFYNYPEFRTFGMRFQQARPSLVSSALAADDCPGQEEYISRMDPSKTSFSIDIEYDASAFGLGMLPGDTNLLRIEAIHDPYLLGITEDAFLNAGAPGPVTILREFYEPINNQWVTFHFYFEELDGTPFFDTVLAYVDMAF